MKADVVETVSTAVTVEKIETVVTVVEEVSARTVVTEKIILIIRETVPSQTSQIWGKRHYQAEQTHFCSHKELTRYIYSPYPP